MTNEWNQNETMLKIDAIVNEQWRKGRYKNKKEYLRIKFGLSLSTYKNYLNKGTSIPAKNLIILAKKLHLSLDELCGIKHG